MRKLVLSLFVTSFCFASKAQFSVAIVGGPQVNSVSPAFSLNADTASTFSKSKHTGINLGFVANSVLNKKQTLFFRAGVLYSAKGSYVIQNFDTSNINLVDGEKYFLQTTTKLKINYIDIPVNLLYKFPLKGKTKFLLGGGVQASSFYSGSTDFSSIRVYKIDPDSVAELDYKQTINKDLLVGSSVNKYKTLHFSANALAGLEFGKVFITVNYTGGLNSFFETDNQSFRHQTLGFHFGIFLGNSNLNKNVATKSIVVADNDKDGISNDLDQCPEMPGTILMHGCPDKDGDSIADNEDRCPEIPGTLENKGCPILDRDSDGVKDEQDKCPDIAGSKKYDGCPIPDSDSDGVNDEEDQCPTIIGDTENHGCPKITKEQQQKIDYAAKLIQFEFKKADLLPSSFKVLDEVVEILKNNLSFNIKVEGHSSGPESESNKILSHKRAESVRDYFINKGVSPTRIIAKGFGSAKHISEDGDKKENPADRRVELIIF